VTVDFQLSAEQLALQEMARDFFAEHSGVANGRAVLDGTADLSDPRAELADLGLLGLLAEPAGAAGSESDGGTLLDLAVVAEQAGRELSPAPLLSTAGWAVPLLAGLAEPGASSLLADVVKGAVAVAVAEQAGVELSPDGTLTGSTRPTVDGSRARTILTLAASPDGPALVAAEIGPAAEAVAQPPFDPTRALATITLSGAPATVLASGESAVARWNRALDVARVVLAAEDLGTVGEAVRRGVEYAQTREAFGRRVGGFQAVKHALVDAYVREEQLRSLVWLAAWSADAAPADLPLYSAAASAYAADAVAHATDVLVHVHGGIGFTWEHDAHLFWRRGRVDRLLLGDEHARRARVAELALQSTRAEGDA
jgi:alkylation response protein AidB-like acyl-CoA dehydrogenase